MSEKISLREARIRAGMSQAVAAARLGCGRWTLSQWESGKKQIPEMSKILLCREYGVKYDDILEESYRRY